MLLHKFQCVSVHLSRHQAIPRTRELKVSAEEPGGKLPFPSMPSSQAQTKANCLPPPQLSPACFICLWLVAQPVLREDWEDEHPSAAARNPMKAQGKQQSALFSFQSHQVD